MATEEDALLRFDSFPRGSSPTKRSSVFRVGNDQVAELGKDEKTMRQLYKHQPSFSPSLLSEDDGGESTIHHLFIEMDELEGEEWVERARWIKYEEDLETQAERWGKPHVASLSFHSLINLRRCIESGVLLLDLPEVDHAGICTRIADTLVNEGVIAESVKPQILRVLNYSHRHVHNNRLGIKAHASTASLGENKPRRRTSSMVKPGREFQDDNCNISGSVPKDSKHIDIELEEEAADKPSPLKRNASSASNVLKRKDSLFDVLHGKEVLMCLEEGTEGCLTLVGSLDIAKPVAALVRLEHSTVVPNTLEVNIPLRFIFLLLTPEKDYNMDCHEIGRSFSTLMSNPVFNLMCYEMQGKRELLHAINIFLDDSVVLPPGDWEKKNILPLNEIMELRRKRQAMKYAVLTGGATPPPQAPVKHKDDEPARNPFARTRTPFGGLINDLRRRYPQYFSDIKDGLHPQCLAAIIFIYFAALSGAIAFGGLMGTKTQDAIGIPETLLISSAAGAVFAALACCPLIIVGSTGPLLLYDESLFSFSQSSGIDYLSWRVWIGIWTFVIAMIVAGFQGSSLVKHFTKFTKDIFASLICLIFIYEAMLKIFKVFRDHPVMAPEEYCSIYSSVNTTQEVEEEPAPYAGDRPNPNTALLSAILMFGTFFIAYFLRIFRNSKFFGRNVRRALGDFGVPIAIVIMVLLDFLVQDTYTEKLKVPEGLQVTNNATRGWLIPPMGNQTELPLWSIFGAVVPALLLYIILFMETEICQLIMMERTKDEKGSGLHSDIVLLSIINIFCGFFGGPWICAATVRAVSHVSALTVMSTNLAPGETPKAVGARDQRVTAFVVSVLLGASVLMAPILKLVPFAVLFGVFLYMGISGMNGVQFFDRLTLFFMPVKHHPQVSYVKRVKTWRMVMFTVFQGLGLAVLWAVKSSPAALAFPFFVLAMIPYRLLLKFIFTKTELDALDGPQAGKDLSGEQDDEDKDFYQAAADLPLYLLAPFSNVLTPTRDVSPKKR